MKEQVLAIIEKHKSNLFLDRFWFEVSDKVTTKDAAAELMFRYPYLDACINYNEESLAKETPEGLERTIVHEMCHIITDPFYAKACNRFASQDEIKDERELLTDYITNLYLKNLKK
jgi:predicted SprT family Zn-dependent metalloprotease